MKKIFLLSIVLSVFCVTYAQTELSVPTPTMEEKYNTTKSLLNNTILSLISVAKSGGMTVEELGKKSGELTFPYWDENSEYEQFVHFAINWLACSADGVRIIEQSSEKVIITVSSLYKRIEEQGVVFDSSVEDYTAFLNAIMSAIAVHLGYGFEMTWGEEAYRVVITK